MRAKSKKETGRKEPFKYVGELIVDLLYISLSVVTGYHPMYQEYYSKCTLVHNGRSDVIYGWGETKEKSKARLEDTIDKYINYSGKGNESESKMIVRIKQEGETASKVTWKRATKANQK